LFLYAMDKIPAIVWKALAFGNIQVIPENFFEQYVYEKNKKVYVYDEGLHFLVHKAAIIKIVQLLRTPEKEDFERFVSFVKWYADNLIISESIITYAALIFGKVKGIQRPKKYNSNDLEKIVKGIENQSWDMYYLSQWSTFYYINDNQKAFAFATDDVTLKMIIVNSIPPGQCFELIGYVFKTKKQVAILRDLFENIFGKNRVKPFEINNEHVAVAIVNEVIRREMNEWERIVNNS